MHFKGKTFGIYSSWAAAFLGAVPLGIYIQTCLYSGKYGRQRLFLSNELYMTSQVQSTCFVLKPQRHGKKSFFADLVNLLSVMLMYGISYLCCLSAQFSRRCDILISFIVKS